MVQAKIVGCLLSLMIVFGLLFGAVAIANDAINGYAKYRIAAIEADSNVAIAKIQAEDHITVACMQYGWFVSNVTCMREGGVNGVGGFSWWSIGLMALVAVAVGWWRTQHA
jgi:hypothetical protein